MKKQDSAQTSSAPMILKSTELPAHDSLPAVPEAHKFMDGATRQGLLKIASDQRAEIDQAMEQLWTDRASIAKDLGTLAPDADEGAVLNARMLAAREANRKAQALAAYTDEQEALANHTVLGHLNTAAADIEHMAQKNPQIAARYARVLAVVVQRREAIVAGMARAKANKATDPKKG